MNDITPAPESGHGKLEPVSAGRNLSPAASASRPRSGIVIDAIAVEATVNSDAEKSESQAPAAEKEKTSAQPRPSETARGRWRIPLAAAACLLAGAAGGVGGSQVLSRHDSKVASLAHAKDEIGKRLAAVEKSAAETRAEITRASATDSRALGDLHNAANAQNAQLVARLDKLDHDLTARVQTLEKNLVSHETTGSIHPLPAPAAPLPPVINPSPRPQANASPAVKGSNDRIRVPRGGWVLRDVRDGSAYVESANGVRQVLPGEVLPGVGRVERIERRDGQWVLVTTNGFIDMTDY